MCCSNVLEPEFQKQLRLQPLRAQRRRAQSRQAIARDFAARRRSILSRCRDARITRMAACTNGHAVKAFNMWPMWATHGPR